MNAGPRSGFQGPRSDRRRAALVSPCRAVLSPRDTGVRTDFLRERVGLLAKLCLSLGLLLFTGNLHRVVFTDTSVQPFFGSAHLVHLRVLALQTTILALSRRQITDGAVLVAMDATLCVGTLSGYAVQAT